MGRLARYPIEVQERAVRLVFEQQASYPSPWAAMVAIAAKMGCKAETLRLWVRRMERDTGKHPAHRGHPLAPILRMGGRG
jgi:transposase